MARMEFSLIGICREFGQQREVRARQLTTTIRSTYRTVHKPTNHGLCTANFLHALTHIRYSLNGWRVPLLLTAAHISDMNQNLVVYKGRSEANLRLLKGLCRRCGHHWLKVENTPDDHNH